MTVTISRPCGECLHMAVCRIQERLASVLADAEVIEPVIDDALEYRIAVDVVCAHFLDRAQLRPSTFLDVADELHDAFPTVFGVDEPQPAPRPASQPVASAPDEATAHRPEVVSATTFGTTGGEAETRTGAPRSDVLVETKDRIATDSGGAPPSPPAVTARQQQYLDAARSNDGNLGAAARDLGLANSGGITQSFAALRERGLMPPDVDAMIERLKAPKPHADGHAEMVLRADAEAQRIARGIAERAREREAAIDVVAGREADDSTHAARARAKAAETWARTHPESV